MNVKHECWPSVRNHHWSAWSKKVFYFVLGW